MPAFTDQTGRTISLENIPRRIISLVPSQTELLFDLDLHDEVIGITKFCVHPPEWSFTKQKVGGTKKINLDIIHQLQPDLIIANKEENVKEQVEDCAKNYPLWVSDVTNLENAYEMIEQVGAMTGRARLAIEITSKTKKNFSELLTINHKPRTCYLIWNDPYMTVGGDTFIHSLMEACGLENIFSAKTRYPVVTIDELDKAGCEVLLLSSEPYPFKQKHIDELQPLLPNTKILLADGEMFSWYGSHLQYAPKYFKELQRSIVNGE